MKEPTEEQYRTRYTLFLQWCRVARLPTRSKQQLQAAVLEWMHERFFCLLYTSDAADE